MKSPFKIPEMQKAKEALIAELKEKSRGNLDPLQTMSNLQNPTGLPQRRTWPFVRGSQDWAFIQWSSSSRWFNYWQVRGQSSDAYSCNIESVASQRDACM